VLLEIQHLKKVYVISGNKESLDLEQTTSVNALRIQRFIHKSHIVGVLHYDFLFSVQGVGQG